MQTPWPAGQQRRGRLWSAEAASTARCRAGACQEDSGIEGEMAGEGSQRHRRLPQMAAQRRGTHLKFWGEADTSAAWMWPAHLQLWRQGSIDGQHQHVLALPLWDGCHLLMQALHSLHTVDRHGMPLRQEQSQQQAVCNM